MVPRNSRGAYCSHEYSRWTPELTIRNVPYLVCAQNCTSYNSKYGSDFLFPLVTKNYSGKKRCRSFETVAPGGMRAHPPGMA